jgi:hypothetical protein
VDSRVRGSGPGRMMGRRSGDAGRQRLLSSRITECRLDRQTFLVDGEMADRQHRARSARRRSRLVRPGVVLRGRRRPLDGDGFLERCHGRIRRLGDLRNRRLDVLFTDARGPGGHGSRSELADDQRQRDHGAAQAAGIGPEANHNQIRIKSRSCSQERQLVARPPQPDSTTPSTPASVADCPGGARVAPGGLPDEGGPGTRGSGPDRRERTRHLFLILTRIDMATLRNATHLRGGRREGGGRPPPRGSPHRRSTPPPSPPLSTAGSPILPGFFTSTTRAAGGRPPPP